MLSKILICFKCTKTTDVEFSIEENQRNKCDLFLWRYNMILKHFITEFCNEFFMLQTTILLFIAFSQPETH